MFGNDLVPATCSSAETATMLQQERLRAVFTAMFRQPASQQDGAGWKLRIARPTPHPRPRPVAPTRLYTKSQAVPGPRAARPPFSPPARCQRAGRPRSQGWHGRLRLVQSRLQPNPRQGPGSFRWVGRASRSCSLAYRTRRDPRLGRERSTPGARGSLRIWLPQAAQCRRGRIDPLSWRAQGRLKGRTRPVERDGWWATRSGLPSSSDIFIQA